MARKNPTISGTSVGMTPPVAGIDNLPLPAGVNVQLKEKNNDMPEVDMTPNNGGNPPAVQAPFASGSDVRTYRATPRHDHTPGKPGAK